MATVTDSGWAWPYKEKACCLEKGRKCSSDYPLRFPNELKYPLRGVSLSDAL